MNYSGLADYRSLRMAACDTASQEAEPVISPEGYPVATFVNATGTSVVEGNSIIYTITIDKMIDRALTFSLKADRRHGS
ncbi:MAG: hypothetical protein U5L72_16935 [Bacteroidales bacterium]|nr:hypothetical protein [Bacteroidales bacterium]